MKFKPLYMCVHEEFVSKEQSSDFSRTQYYTQTSLFVIDRHPFLYQKEEEARLNGQSAQLRLKKKILNKRHKTQTNLLQLR